MVDDIRTRILELSFGAILGGSNGKVSACNAGDLDLIPGSRGPLEKEMATEPSILTWRIPCTEEPGRLESMRFQRVQT